jgi:hypothetical protein
VILDPVAAGIGPEQDNLEDTSGSLLAVLCLLELLEEDLQSALFSQRFFPADDQDGRIRKGCPDILLHEDRQHHTTTECVEPIQTIDPGFAPREIIYLPTNSPSD